MTERFNPNDEQKLLLFEIRDMLSERYEQANDLSEGSWERFMNNLEKSKELVKRTRKAGIPYVEWANIHLEICPEEQKGHVLRSIIDNDFAHNDELLTFEDIYYLREKHNLL